MAGEHARNRQGPTALGDPDRLCAAAARRGRGRLRRRRPLRTSGRRHTRRPRRPPSPSPRSRRPAPTSPRAPPSRCSSRPTWRPSSPMPTLSPPVAGPGPCSPHRSRSTRRPGRSSPARPRRSPSPAVAAGVVGSEGQHLAQTVTSHFTVAPGSTLRLQQLLAELGYLPLTFTPASPVTSPIPGGQRSGGDVQLALARPAARRSTTLWTPGVNNVITQGAVMNFENQNGLKTDGLAGPQVWTDLLADVQSGKGNANRGTTCSSASPCPRRPPSIKNGSRRLQHPGQHGRAGRAHRERHVAGLRPLHGDDHERHQPGRLALRRTRASRGSATSTAATPCTASSGAPTASPRATAAWRCRSPTPKPSSRSPRSGPWSRSRRKYRRPGVSGSAAALTCHPGVTRCAGLSTSSARSSSGPASFVLLFTAYQIWGTSIQESHTQNALRSQLQSGDQQRGDPPRPGRGGRARQAADRAPRHRAAHGRPGRGRAHRRHPHPGDRHQPGRRRGHEHP